MCLHRRITRGHLELAVRSWILLQALEPSFLYSQGHSTLTNPMVNPGTGSWELRKSWGTHRVHGVCVCVRWVGLQDPQPYRHQKSYASLRLIYWILYKISFDKKVLNLKFMQRLNILEQLAWPYTWAAVCFQGAGPLCCLLLLTEAVFCCLCLCLCPSSFLSTLGSSHF